MGRATREPDRWPLPKGRARPIKRFKISGAQSRSSTSCERDRAADGDSAGESGGEQGDGQRDSEGREFGENPVGAGHGPVARPGAPAARRPGMPVSSDIVNATQATVAATRATPNGSPSAAGARRPVRRRREMLTSAGTAGRPRPPRPHRHAATRRAAAPTGTAGQAAVTLKWVSTDTSDHRVLRPGVQVPSADGTPVAGWSAGRDNQQEPSPSGT